MDELISKANALDLTAPLTVRLAGKTSGEILGDVMAGITVGTLCRSRPVTAVVLGVRNSDGFNRSGFRNSLPGIVAMQLAKAVAPDGGGDSFDVEVGRARHQYC